MFTFCGSKSVQAPWARRFFELYYPLALILAFIISRPWWGVAGGEPLDQEKLHTGQALLENTCWPPGGVSLVLMSRVVRAISTSMLSTCILALVAIG